MVYGCRGEGIWGLEGDGQSMSRTDTCMLVGTMVCGFHGVAWGALGSLWGCAQAGLQAAVDQPGACLSLQWRPIATCPFFTQTPLHGVSLLFSNPSPQASLRRRYGNRTAALLTRVVTGAQQVHNIQATMVRSGSLLKNPISSFRLHWSGRSSVPTPKGAVTASGREVVVGVDGEELEVLPRRQSAPGGSVASGIVGAEERRESSMRGRGVSSSSGAMRGGEVPGGREWAAAVAMRKAKLAQAEVAVRLEGEGSE